MKKNMKYIIGIIIVVILIMGVYFFSQQPVTPGKYDDFAKCVSSRGLTMYGAVWCSHCINEKKAFGTSFQYINYVECPDNIQLCTDLGINGYPSWLDGQGNKYEGEQGLEKIAQITNCELPQ